jgi:transcriptional regulator with XRE-family HTH domain
MSIPLCIIEWEDCEIGKRGTMSVLGDYIREEMDRQGVSQVELEERTEIPDTTLSRILVGQEPKPTQIARIAKALGVKFWALMQRGGYTTETPDDPTEEARRLAEVLASRPQFRDLLREAEQLTPEERDATLAYMKLLRQNRRQNRHRSRRKSPPTAPEDK